MPTVVVTGASSGIGNAFARILVQEGYNVYAADIEVGDKLRALGAHSCRLDVGSPESIASFKEHFGDQPLDLLLNIAGVMAPAEQDSLENTDLATMIRTFMINTFGPLLLTQALLPNLLLSSSPRIGNMSSRVGSIGDNTTGGHYAYRSSKAALNSISKSLAMDLKSKGVVTVMLHPGYVRTGLDPTTYTRSDAVEPTYAAKKLWKVLMNKNIEDTGTFWHREGQELPW
ncbi:MAG: hypothetical protein M1827_006091 [Pycnora praestabilis]|nr:MAG: hypothetical protein M1827_006091 [Pycnora praestabilis]